MEDLQYLQTEQRKRLLRILNVIMHFTHRVVIDLDDGVIDADGSTLIDYSEFDIPDGLKDYIIKNVIVVRPSYLIKAYLSVLCTPNRIDTLIDAFTNAFKNYGHLYTDLDFMLYTIMCSLISVELYDRGFREAKDIAVETIRGICSQHNKYDAFRKFGCVIDQDIMLHITP